jgi:type VI secretion system secreted protein VgrG
MAADYTQENRLIAIKVDGQGDDDLLLNGFNCTEAISRPYVIHAEVLSQEPEVDFTDIIGQKATITLQTNDENNPRYFSGYVSRFAQSGSDSVFHHYHMEIVPWIWFLSRHADCRIFHNLTIPQIIQKVFDAFTAKTKGPIQTNLQATYTAQEYVVQYRETSLNFISRLMEHAGIYYYFSHTDTDHTLIIADTSASAKDCPIQSTASHADTTASGDMFEDRIASLRLKREFKTGIYTSTDYNFKTPSTNMVASENTVISVGGNDPLEIFDYPGVHGTADEGRSISKIRMQEHEAAHRILSGSGHVRSFIPGYAFAIENHYRSELNDSFLLTEVQHAATVGGTYLGGQQGGGISYHNQFTCIPMAVPYRPPRVTPKPLVHGPQTATVVGKSQDSANSSDDNDPGTDGEEIWVDKYGRVIVLFPWDRAGQCSCWVRVSQEWAGQGWGSITIPRVGQEVLVSFLDGDPDRPIITGRVYNANQTVPYLLPDNQTRSTFMTRSSKGGSSSTYNELRFEDKMGAEQVFIRAQYDYDTQVLHDTREAIGNNRSLTVAKDQMETVGGDLHTQISGGVIETVGKDVNTNITGNVVEKVGGDVNRNISGKVAESVGGDSNLGITGNLNLSAGEAVNMNAGTNLVSASGTAYSHNAGTSIDLQGGTTVTIQAGVTLTLSAGSSFITIGPAGVTIVGSPLVMINSGGAAQSANTPSPASPASPTSPGSPTDPDKADDGSKGTKLN